CQQGNTFLTF
nr:immunoglobulin light chain junction region [Macaca mulatta]